MKENASSDNSETIAKLKRKIMIYTILEIAIVIVLILFGAFLLNITLA